MRTRQEMETALAALGRQDRLEAAPEHPPAALLAEFDAGFAPGGRGRRLAWLPAIAGGAACVAVALALLQPAPMRRTAPEHAFVPIPYVAPLAPYERPQVVRMDVPMMALVAAGVPVHAPDLSGAVTADVLVGQDGRALAVRLVPGPVNDRNRRYEE